MRYAFLPAAAAALLLASCSEVEEELPGDAAQAVPSATATASPTPAVKGQLWRWFKVTVVIPEGYGLFPEQGYWSDDRPVLNIGPVDDFGEGVTIDAQTGAVIQDRVRPQDRAVFDKVLQTVAVSPFDAAAAPWPYNGEAPGAEREGWGNVTFIRPEPGTGIAVRLFVGGDVQLSNGRSTLSIDGSTGAVYSETTSVAPEDQEAFARFFSATRLAER